MAKLILEDAQSDVITKLTVLGFKHFNNPDYSRREIHTYDHPSGHRVQVDFKKNTFGHWSPREDFIEAPRTKPLKDLMNHINSLHLK